MGEEKWIPHVCCEVLEGGSPRPRNKIDSGQLPSPEKKASKAPETLGLLQMSFLSGFGLTGAKCSFSGNEYSFPQLATLPTPPRNKTEKGMRCFRTILFLATFWPSEIVFFSVVFSFILENSNLNYAFGLQLHVTTVVLYKRHRFPQA